MKKYTLFCLFVSLAAISGMSCSSSCKDSGACECVSQYDCKEGFVCRSGACVEDNGSPWIIAERKYGEKCIAHRECIDGICLPLGPDNGGVCTKSCAGNEDCPNPDAEECKTWTGNAAEPDTGRVCVAKTASRLCDSCAVDGHCNATGDLCVESADGMICAQDCAQTDCPTGYSCETIERNNASFRQCIPFGNSCDCGPGKVGLGISCNNANEFGSCSGRKYCEQTENGYEWSECDARIPQAEVCNGIDDDCDGLIDAADPDISVDSETDEIGAEYPICYVSSCVGRWVCAKNEHDLYYWYCDAVAPERELCNGVDDNCNGLVDEPFVDDEGRYVHIDHCGACGASCNQILAHLAKNDDGTAVQDAASCELRGDVPTCIPKKCEDGYYPYPHENPISCVKLESPACQVCDESADCNVYTDVCADLGGDFSRHCLQSCDEKSPYPGCSGQIGVQSCCPDGYLCQIYAGAKHCIPKGSSCSCDADKVGMTRNCVVTSQTGICQGRQTCQKADGDAFAWSDCAAQTLTQELCDGQDNDCDGEIDEDFKDDQGRYNHPNHCGACNADCESRWKAPELHADGACLPDGQSYSCQFSGCKLETRVAGKRCQQDADCASGQKCDRQFYYCVADGGSDVPVSCNADSACASIDPALRCIDAKCQLRIQFHDVNKIDADGCECGVAVDGGSDEPDLFNQYPTETSLYIDRNCDGIDGTEATSLFVSAQSKISRGTREHPYATIAEAIKAYDAGKHTAILVAAGTYLEQVQMRSGVRLYGGYAQDFLSRNIVLNPTQIIAPPPADDSKPGTVYFPAVKSMTLISGFVIAGYDADESEALADLSGRNTYAVYLEQAQSNIVIADNAIVGGRAGDGADGSPGNSGYAGNDGKDGQDSFECNAPTCYGVSGKGGEAGTNRYCKAAAGIAGAAAQGGNGSTQDYRPAYGSDLRNGAGGDNNRYLTSRPEHADYCKYDCISGGYANGSDAANGANGKNGAGGAGCSDAQGTVKNGRWTGYSASDGANGGAAYGGGGGGAGGNADNLNMPGCSQGNLVGDVGGSGGGGGAGGCGGNGGAAGGPGGGSFAVWIAKTVSQAKIYGNAIRLGQGGNGGRGGSGGAGGNGGKGGKGGTNVTPAWCAGVGGSGGTGGKGGSGGGGGGGCGGITAGIAGIGAISAYAAKNTFSAQNDGDSAYAQGGAGGDSPESTADGAKGANGIISDIAAF